jgi:hypothetical protein
MPATSNAIEILNGYLHKVTPRSNRFWSSLIRLADVCLRNGQTFHCSLKHNYQYECRQSLQRQHAVAENQMASEITFFGTTDVVCLCGETQFTSDMYRIALLCSHQFAVRFQAMPDLIQHHFGGMRSKPPILELITPDFHWSPDTISFVIDQMVPYCPRDTYLQRDMEQIAKKIITVAHGHRRRDEIEQWVISNHRTSNEFSLGESTAFWWMIEMGVQIFRSAA